MLILPYSNPDHGRFVGLFSQGNPYRAGLLLAALIAVALPASSQAEEDGRYRAIVLHEGGAYSQTGSVSPKVFILDSREGHMWTWEQNAQIKNAQGNLRFGTTTVYQGKLKIGRHMGEVVEQNR